MKDHRTFETPCIVVGRWVVLALSDDAVGTLPVAKMSSSADHIQSGIPIRAISRNICEDHKTFDVFTRIVGKYPDKAVSVQHYSSIDRMYPPICRRAIFNIEGVKRNSLCGIEALSCDKGCCILCRSRVLGILCRFGQKGGKSQVQ